MYNETINALSSIALLIIFGSILLCWFSSNVKIVIPDEIVLGKIIDPQEYATYKEVPPPPVPAKVSNVVRPINKPKKKKKKKNKAKQQAKEQLKKDCYDTAISLGAKAKEANYLVKKIFSENKIKSVQEFLQKAYA
jgi:hypothetical protein